MPWHSDMPGNSCQMILFLWVPLILISYRATQRGHYPDEPKKDNQDSCIVLPQLGEFKDISFFGVFDGHGKDGHLCSRYARDHVYFSSLLILASTLF